jgi:hypothetical protein
MLRSLDVVCGENRTGRAAAAAASNAISHIAQHGNIPPPAIPPPAPPPITVKKKRRRKTKLADLPFEIKTMIVDILDKDKCYFDVWSLSLVSRSWMTVVSGGEEVEAEEKWKKRYQATAAATRRVPSTTLPSGSTSWRETHLRFLSKLCYGCRNYEKHKPASYKWPKLAEWKWANMCFDCSGDGDERICDRCCERTFAWECDYQRCCYCCPGCDRHPKYGRGGRRY